MEKLLNMTLKEIIDSGAKTEITYYHTFDTDEVEALDKITTLTGEQVVEGREWEHIGVFKSTLHDEGITVRSYYFIEPEESETEHAQANLTEYERKMKEAGLKESDFA